MKKVLSLILAVCMIASFAMVASAATQTSSMTLDVVEGETTVTATLTLDGTFTDVNEVMAFVKYDTAKMTFASIAASDAFQALMDAETAWANYSNDQKYSTAAIAGHYYIGFATTDPAGASGVAGTDVEIATVTFNKVADVAAADIALVASVKAGRATKYTMTKYDGVSGETKATPANNFTNYEEVVVVDPAVTTESADVAIVVDEVADGTANYTVTVTAAPVFGKAYVVKANGEVINAGVEYAATEATVITVELVDDATKAIHTFAKAYSAAGEAAVFAKFTNGAADYGFKVAAFADDTFSPDMEVFIKDGVFAAANAVDGVFGVKFTGVEAGSYDAVPYADGVEGDAITFVVE